MYPRKTYGTPKEETSGKSYIKRSIFHLYCTTQSLEVVKIDAKS